MRVLCLLPYFADFFGGPVRHVKMLAREIEREGHQFVVYTTDLADRSGNTTTHRNSGLEVHAFPVKWWVGDYFYTPGLKTALLKEDFDLVHAHCYRNYQADLAGWVVQRKRVPLVFTAHGTLVTMATLKDRLLKGLYDAMSSRAVLRNSSRVVALSTSEFAQYHSFGIESDRIVKIYHGVDATYFSPTDDGAIRQDLGIEEAPIILYIGRLHQRKGLQHLLLAFKDVLDEFSSAKLVVCGADYGYRQKLEKQIVDLALSDSVILTGEVADDVVPQLYNAADIVVLPARYEIFGQVLAEAGACEKAIVTVRWGWAKEFFQHREDCLFVEYGDSDSIKEALLQLLRDSDLRLKLGASARKKIVQALSWEKCGKQHLRIYEELNEHA